MFHTRSHLDSYDSRQIGATRPITALQMVQRGRYALVGVITLEETWAQSSHSSLELEDLSLVQALSTVDMYRFYCDFFFFFLLSNWDGFF